MKIVYSYTSLVNGSICYCSERDGALAGRYAVEQSWFAGDAWDCFETSAATPERPTNGIRRRSSIQMRHARADLPDAAGAWAHYAYPGSARIPPEPPNRKIRLVSVEIGPGVAREEKTGLIATLRKISRGFKTI